MDKQYTMAFFTGMDGTIRLAIVSISLLVILDAVMKSGYQVSFGVREGVNFNLTPTTERTKANSVWGKVCGDTANGATDIAGVES